MTELFLNPHLHFLNALRSRLSSSGEEHGVYAQLSDALNYGLECLSEIDVEGLPEFEDHIVFVPSNEGVTSDWELESLLSKPDVALMRLVTACDFRGIKDTKGLTVSQFVSKIPEETTSKRHLPNASSSTRVAKTEPSKSNPSQTVPAYRVGWKDILSAVEVKRNPKKLPILETFTDEVASVADMDTDEEPATSRNPDHGTPSEISESQTRKIPALVYGHATEN